MIAFDEIATGLAEAIEHAKGNAINTVEHNSSAVINAIQE